MCRLTCAARCHWQEDDGDAEKKIFIIGGYGGHGSTRECTMDVHALDLDNMVWSRIDRIKGPPPKPRCDHTVCVADNLLILSGGRGDSTDKPKFSGYFEDVHILDLAEQEWKRPGLTSGIQPEEGQAVPSWPGLPSTLWCHSAVAIESVPSYRMFVFGGQREEFKSADTVEVLDTGRMAWTPAVFAAGSPAPKGRAECGVAYDVKSCNLIYYGGWRMG